jgi:hypothetical protein
VDQTGSIGGPNTLQLAIDKLPSHAVVDPTGHGVHGSAPEEFLYNPLAQGKQPNVEKEKASPAAHDRSPVKKSSTRCTSASESFTLYTRMERIAKSETSCAAEPVFMESVSNA